MVYYLSPAFFWPMKTLPSIQSYHRHRRTRAAALILAMGLGLFCSGVSVAQTPYDPFRDSAPVDDPLTDAIALDSADRLFLAGDMLGASASYKRALAAFPDTEYLDQGLYRLGAALSALGKKGEAREYWERLLVQAPDSPFASEVGGELLTIYRQEREWDRALDILLTQLGKAQGEDKAVLLAEISQVQMSLEEPGKALKNLLRRQRYLPPAQRQLGQEEIRALVDGQFTISDLESLADRFAEPMPGAWILERLVRHALSAGEVYQTDRWADAYQSAFPRQPMARELKGLIKAQRKRLRAHTHRVAVLLPVTGPLGDYGQPVLNGIRLAYRIAADRLPDGELALWVRDQTLDRSLLGGHVKPLLKAAHPEILIGPLLSRDVRQAARLTRAAGVPLIAPMVPALKRGGGGVIGLGITPEMEGIAAARYGLRDAGLERFVVMAPIGPYGDRVARAFSDALVAMGGSVQTTLRYEPDGAGVRAQVKRLVANDLAADGVPEVTEEDMAHLDEAEQELAGIDQDEEPTIEIGLTPTLPLMGPPVGPHPYAPGFDGVFLAGSWNQVVLVAPQLPFHDINTPILGTSGWNDRRLISKGGSALSGAIFVSPLFIGAEPGGSFARAYRDAYDQEPDIFSALGFDAMNLAIQALRKADAEGGEPNLVGPFAGVTGIFAVEENGQVIRDFGVLKVRRNSFGQLLRVPAVVAFDPAPTLLFPLDPDLLDFDTGILAEPFGVQ
jgi:ABC-type branched-subunit amino acid transport system substrate-binding protein